MAIREATVAGIPARVCRVSFSGELAYEVNVRRAHGLALWEAVMAAGEPYGITPYGTETMHVLRAEKGYVIVGQDTDGTVTPQDLGLDWMVVEGQGRLRRAPLAPRAPDTRAPGPQAARRPAARRPSVLPEGAQLVARPGAPRRSRWPGHVTSSYDSAALGPAVRARAAGGRPRARTARPSTRRSATAIVAAAVAEPVLYDPEGARRDG